MDKYHVSFSPEENERTERAIPYRVLFKDGPSGPTAGEKMVGLIEAGDPKAAAFERILIRQGFALDCHRHGGWGKICCVSTAFTGYLRVGDERFEEAMRILQAAWKGSPDSLRHEVLDSVVRFVDLYHGEYDPGRLICRLRAVDPVKIFVDGKLAGSRLVGYRRYLYQIYLIYIGTNRKYFLPRKF